MRSHAVRSSALLRTAGKPVVTRANARGEGGRGAPQQHLRTNGVRSAAAGAFSGSKPANEQPGEKCVHGVPRARERGARLG